MSTHKLTAVMASRAANPPNALDYFPTPPWATRALCHWLRARQHSLELYRAWEPACGEGHMARPLREFFKSVRASDVFPYGDHELIDFPLLATSYDPVDWVITNPPFLLGEEFIAAAMAVAMRGIAMLVRTAFLEGEERTETLFDVNPPTHIIQFRERVVMLRGRLIRAGSVDPFSEKEGNKASTTTAYCWLVWDLNFPRRDPPRPPEFHWFPKCRRQLEQPGDYPIYPLKED